MDALNKIYGAVAEAWSTLLDSKVGLGKPKTSPFPAREALETLRGTHVSCIINFSGDLKGSSLVLIPAAEVKTMVGMMMASAGGEVENSDSDELGETDLDAIKEVLNQMAATAATVLRSVLGGDVSAKLGHAEKVDLDAELQDFADGDLLCKSVLELDGTERGSIFQVLPAGIVAVLKKGGSPSPAASAKSPSSPHDFEKYGDMEIEVSVVLADRNMKVPEVLNLCVGSVIQFKKIHDNPVNLEISDRVFANGEIVTTQDHHFALRVIEVAPADVSAG